jgi:hypothetical protein
VRDGEILSLGLFWRKEKLLLLSSPISFSESSIISVAGYLTLTKQGGYFHRNKLCFFKKLNLIILLFKSNCFFFLKKINK